MNLKRIQEVDVKNKKVFLRVDLDVPLVNGRIVDDTRLNAWFGTLEYLIKKGAEVVLAGHLGRPEKEFPFLNFQFASENEKYSLFPVVIWLCQKIKVKPEVIRLNKFTGWKLAENLVVLENLRFFKEEEDCDSDFSQKLSELADIYVNDAFASSHRAHASTFGITKHLPSFAGLRLQEEVKVLLEILEKPKRPLAVVIGGAKIETKLPLVEKMHHFADFVLVGGEIAENDKVLFKVQHEKMAYKKSILLIADLTENGKDISQKSAENFVEVLEKAETIVWNGPMGLVEEDANAFGTKILADGLVKTNSYKILGGGDTVSCIQKLKLINKFDFVSIGGGAMLELLSGEKLPGIEALK